MLGCPTWNAKVCKTTPLQCICKGPSYWSRSHTTKPIWLQKCSRRAQYKTYSTVPKYGYVTIMRYFVRMAEKLTFRVKKCSNYKPAIMILCMLAYTDHSPFSSLKYHRNSILWPHCGYLGYAMTILRWWGGEWSVYACMYKIMKVGLVGAHKGTLFCYTNKNCVLVT